MKVFRWIFPSKTDDSNKPEALPKTEDISVED